MFGGKKVEDEEGSKFPHDAACVRYLDRKAYDWLGDHYAWYDKVRKAKKDDASIFQDPSLEGQMLATRAALNDLTDTLQSSIANSYNTVVAAMAKGGSVPDGWPAPLEITTHGPHPTTRAEHDALILEYQPLKFLNLAKTARTKGKGVPFYSDGLVKKLWFKVIGYYCDESHWDGERLGLLVSRIPADAPLADVTNRLAGLKAEVDTLLNVCQPFKFGRSHGGADPTAKNAADDLFKATDEELISDLYLQHLILQGLDAFVFRYYVTLMGGADNPRVPRALSHMFLPLLHKTEELRQQFQGSFLMERDKMRLRAGFQAFFKDVEARPPLETFVDGDFEYQRIVVSHRALDAVALARTPALSPHQERLWSHLLEREVAAKVNTERGYSFLLELLNSVVSGTQNAVDGKLKAAKNLHDFAHEQEKLGLSQIARKRRLVAENKRHIIAKASRFKAEKRLDVVKAYEDRANAMEADANKQLDAMQEAVTHRRDSLLARAQQMEKMAKEEGEQNTGRASGNIYRLAVAADVEKTLRGGLLEYLSRHSTGEKDASYQTLYRFLFGVLSDLSPTEKMTLRKVVSSRMDLGKDDLAVSEEEERLYRQEIITAKTELNMEAPGLMESKIVHGQFQTKLEHLLDMGLTQASLEALLSLPVSAPGKPAAALAPEVVDRLKALNRTMNPIPEHDVLLTNVDPDAPAAKRINFSRLAKLA
jgi:hypothetical protein